VEKKRNGFVDKKGKTEGGSFPRRRKSCRGKKKRAGPWKGRFEGGGIGPRRGSIGSNWSRQRGICKYTGFPMIPLP